MIPRAAAALTLLLWLPHAATADAAFARLWDLMGLRTYIEVTRDEGLGEIDGLAADMLGGTAGTAFRQQITAIYDADRLQETVYSSMEAQLTDDQIDAALIVFDSALGEQIVTFETAARRAFTDEEIEAAAKEAWADAEMTYPELAPRIRRFIEVNDLVERNVAGALNSSLRFYAGLADGGALDMTPDEMLAEVQRREPEVRADTEAWLGGYILLAYQPLPPEDVDTYIAFWETAPGRALNAALFDAFDLLYDEIAYATGRVVALHMGARDL